MYKYFSEEMSDLLLDKSFSVGLTFPVLLTKSSALYSIREAAKNGILFSGPATKALPPPPPNLEATKILPEFFFKLQKAVFFLSGQALYNSISLRHTECPGSLDTIYIVTNTT